MVAEYRDLSEIAAWDRTVLVEDTLYQDKLARWPEPLQWLKLESWLYAIGREQREVDGWALEGAIIFERREPHEADAHDVRSC